MHFTVLHGYNDSDIFADFREAQVNVFVEKFKSVFNVDEVMICEAARNQRSFNIIHLETFFKMIFFSKNASLTDCR